jgi:hypothetical protein
MLQPLCGLLVVFRNHTVALSYLLSVVESASGKSSPAGIPSDVRGEQRSEILTLVDSISVRRLPSGPISVSRRRSAIV